MLDLIARHERFIKSFHVSLYEQEGEMLRFKAQITFTNDSKLFIKEYLFENKERKYAYHWTDTSGMVINQRKPIAIKYRYQLQTPDSKFTARWDNAPHHKTVTSFPHHKHCRDGATIASSINNIFEILNSLDDELKDKI